MKNRQCTKPRHSTGDLYDNFDTVHLNQMFLLIYFVFFGGFSSDENTIFEAFLKENILIPMRPGRDTTKKNRWFFDQEIGFFWRFFAK